MVFFFLCQSFVEKRTDVGIPFRPQNNQPFPFRAGRWPTVSPYAAGDPDEVAKAGLLQALQDHPGGTASRRLKNLEMFGSPASLALRAL